MDRREQQKQAERRSGARAWAEMMDRGWEPTSIRLPDHVNKYKLEQTGFVKLDIIPYIVGKGNPAADEGSLHFERTFFVHNGLGLSGKSAFICLQETCKKKCAICEYIRNQGNQIDPELLKKIRVQRRHLFNVIDVGNRAASIRVWDAPSGGKRNPDFGQRLASKTMAVEAYENFCQLTKAKGGMTLQLTVEANPPYGNRVTNIEMLPRTQDYKDTIIQKATCLDDCLIIMTYQEQYKAALHPGEDEDGDGSTVDAGSNGQAPGTDDLVDDLVDADTAASDDVVDDTVAGDDVVDDTDADTVASDDVAATDDSDIIDDTDTAASDDAVTDDDDGGTVASDDDDLAPAPPPPPARKPAQPAKPPAKPQAAAPAKPAAAPAKPVAKPQPAAPAKPTAAKPTAPPAVNPTKPETAGAFKIGMSVDHAKYGRCEIVEIKGGKLTLEDKSGKEFASVDPKSVTVPKKK